MTSSNVQLATQAAPSAPLVVRLNDTLVKSNIVIDSFLHLVRTSPALLLQMPRWLLSDPQSVGTRLENAASLEAEHLPYHQELLHFLREEKQHGRKIYLLTQSDGRLAQQIVEHLDVFNGTLLERRHHDHSRYWTKFGLDEWQQSKAYAYAGHALSDLKHFRNATERIVVNADSSLFRALGREQLEVHRSLQDRYSRLSAVRRAMRVHQWAKNVLLFVPMLLAHLIGMPTLLHTALGCLAFGLFASATYIVNDLLDLDADRRHHLKRSRPFAAGTLSAPTGFLMITVLVLLGLCAIVALPRGFSGWLLLYLAGTLSYSFRLKKVVLVDVIVLAGLYTVRLLAGAAITQIAVSPWLGGFSMFLFLSLAMVKRFSELENLRASGKVPQNGRGYQLLDLALLRSVGIASGYAAILVFSIYITSRDVVALYQHPGRMWLIAPVLIWWISRYWLLAGRGEMHEDPVVFALKDRVSLATGALIAAIGVAAL